jgi:hypothetical protein
MKIVFYGDSFCEFESKFPYGETYIRKLKNHYNADIVNLGIGASSIWDIMLLQFDIHNIPDVCIFVWTDPGRLFHRQVRTLTASTVENRENKILHPFVFKAAKEYYKHLYDPELVELQYIAALQYFDLNILSNCNSKIVHLWSFAKPYNFNWKHGTVIDTPLMDIVLEDDTIENVNKKYFPNHLRNEEKNNKVFNLIKQAIDSYED